MGFEVLMAVTVKIFTSHVVCQIFINIKKHYVISIFMKMELIGPIEDYMTP
jgi:hypothetical protein